MGMADRNNVNSFMLQPAYNYLRNLLGVGISKFALQGFREYGFSRQRRSFAMVNPLHALRGIQVWKCQPSEDQLVLIERDVHRVSRLAF